MSAADLVSVQAVVCRTEEGRRYWALGGGVCVWKLRRKERECRCQRWMVTAPDGREPVLLAEKRAAFLLADEWARGEA